MSKLKLALTVTSIVLTWYVEAAEDRQITPEEGVDLLKKIAEALGLSKRIHINVAPIE